MDRRDSQAHPSLHELRELELIGPPELILCALQFVQASSADLFSVVESEYKIRPTRPESV